MLNTDTDTGLKTSNLQLLICDLCDFKHGSTHIFKQHLREHIKKTGKKEEY